MVRDPIWTYRGPTPVARQPRKVFSWQLRNAAASLGFNRVSSGRVACGFGLEFRDIEGFPVGLMPRKLVSRPSVKRFSLTLKVAFFRALIIADNKRYRVQWP